MSLLVENCFFRQHGPGVVHEHMYMLRGAVFLEQWSQSGALGDTGRHWAMSGGALAVTTGGVGATGI